MRGDQLEMNGMNFGKLYNNDLYLEDVRYVADLDLPWEKLQDKSILISGATGLVGSFLIDVLLQKNASEGMSCRIYALSRNEEKAKARFCKYENDHNLIFIPYDVKLPFERDDIGKVDFVLHLASNTHPMQYAEDPIGTITTNIIGVRNMLEFAVSHHAARFAFTSSNEVYGENRGDVELFEEDYCGYINCNTVRAGYPESKRCGEALCQAYKAAAGLEVVIPRLTRTYGPTMQKSDSKAMSQFIRKGIAGEDIVLKSAGTQHFSYQYVADSVSGLLTILLLGENGEAYNIAAESGDIILKDLAAIIAGINGKQVVFEQMKVAEAAAYSKVTKARLDGRKLQALGWKPRYDVKSGMERTIRILRDIS